MPQRYLSSLISYLPHYSFIVLYCAGNGAACKVDCLRLIIDFVVTCLAFTVGNYRGVLGSDGTCALANLQRVDDSIQIVRNTRLHSHLCSFQFFFWGGVLFFPRFP